MEKISFCINTAKNERFHLELLFKSLRENLSRKDHEIIVFIENDNQNTIDFLLTQKDFFQELKIIKNTLPIPIGYARNINLMFEMAKYDIVSYLQSDMVICKNYDVEVLKHIKDNIVISATRIEPPLHPPSVEKITYDFGLDPINFDMDKFVAFSESSKKDFQTDYWFAPFTLYKNIWNDIGGHDTFFRRSREDSDILYRFSLNKIKTIQIWNANVYHFTCTSSRGIKWWEPQNVSSRGQLQKLADQVEMTRFLWKWPGFKHSSEYDPSTEYKYEINCNLYNVNESHISDILNNYFRFNKIYIDNPKVRSELQYNYDRFHIYANQLLDITYEQWELYKRYYRTIAGKDVFVDTPIKDEKIIFNLNQFYSQIFQDPSIIQLNNVINSVKYSDGPGQYELCNGVLNIIDFEDTILKRIKVENPSITEVTFDIL